MFTSNIYLVAFFFLFSAPFGAEGFKCNIDQDPCEAEAEKCAVSVKFPSEDDCTNREYHYFVGENTFWNYNESSYTFTYNCAGPDDFCAKNIEDPLKLSKSLSLYNKQHKQKPQVPKEILECLENLGKMGGAKVPVCVASTTTITTEEAQTTESMTVTTTESTTTTTTTEPATTTEEVTTTSTTITSSPSISESSTASPSSTTSEPIVVEESTSESKPVLLDTTMEDRPDPVPTPSETLATEEVLVEKTTTTTTKPDGPSVTSSNEPQTATSSADYTEPVTNPSNNENRDYQKPKRGFLSSPGELRFLLLVVGLSCIELGLVFILIFLCRFSQWRQRVQAAPKDSGKSNKSFKSNKSAKSNKSMSNKSNKSGTSRKSMTSRKDELRSSPSQSTPEKTAKKSGKTAKKAAAQPNKGANVAKGQPKAIKRK